MSMGNPIVSTGIGAEGLRAVKNKHLKLAENAKDFANAVLQLLSDPMMFDSVRADANTWVSKQYDWEIIGHDANIKIASLLS